MLHYIRRDLDGQEVYVPVEVNEFFDEEDYEGEKEEKMKYTLEEDKLACKIHAETGCTWQEAFDMAQAELSGGEE